MAAGTLIYPKGQIAMENGDLFDVTNVKVSTTNNGKQKHTLRRKAAGVTLGVEETTVDFDALVSELGQERDYFTAIKKGKIKQLRVKIPNETLTVVGIFTTREFDLPLDDAIKLSMKFIGELQG